MKRIAFLVLATVLLCGTPFAAFAEESGAAAPVPAAPAQAGEPVMEGCQAKADGSPCCGSAACRQEKKEAAASGAPGGCPCQRAKAAAAAKKGS